MLPSSITSSRTPSPTHHCLALHGRFWCHRAWRLLPYRWLRATIAACCEALPSFCCSRTSGSRPLVIVRPNRSCYGCWSAAAAAEASACAGAALVPLLSISQCFEPWRWPLLLLARRSAYSTCGRSRSARQHACAAGPLCRWHIPWVDLGPAGQFWCWSASGC